MKDILSLIAIAMLLTGLIIQEFIIDDYNEITNEQHEMIVEYREMHEDSLEIIDDWKAAYTGLQEEHSQAVEKIEQLEYELEMSGSEN